MIGQIVTGIVIGIGYAIAGWQKQSIQEKHKTTKLDWLLLGKSTIICGIVGAIAGYSGDNFSLLITGGLGIGVTKVVDMVWKFVKLKLVPK